MIEKVKRRGLQLPAKLVVVALGAAATTGAVASTSCGGDDAPQDANNGCSVFCFSGFTDAGVPPDGGCPLCATFVDGVPTCPMGCEPLG